MDKKTWYAAFDSKGSRKTKWNTDQIKVRVAMARSGRRAQSNWRIMKGISHKKPTIDTVTF